MMSGLAAVSLLAPGGWLEPMWRINPPARVAFADMGGGGIVMLLLVCAGCALSAFGLWRRLLWGHRLATAILIVNVAGDSGRAFVDPRAAIGVPVAGAMIAYLLRRRTRQWFRAGPSRTD